MRCMERGHSTGGTPGRKRGHIWKKLLCRGTPKKGHTDGGTNTLKWDERHLEEGSATLECGMYAS